MASEYLRKPSEGMKNRSCAIPSPAISASYSGSLFVALKSYRIKYIIWPPYGDLRTTPKPDPLILNNPSTCMVQGLSSRLTIVHASDGISGSSSGLESATKFAKTCDLIVVLGLYSMS